MSSNLSNVAASPIPASAVARPRRKLLLRPAVGWQPVNVAELWQYRELLWILALRDIKVRYKQTLLGAGWALIQPFFLMLVFTIISKMGHLDTEGAPVQLFQYTGLIIWQLFSSSVSNAGNSLISNQNLITKVYFPRLVIPMAAVVTGLVDFAIAFVLQLVMMLWYHWPLGPQLLLLPFFVGLAFVASLGVGLWLAALNVEFRDIRYVIPFMLQFLLFATPVLYSSAQVQSPWKRVLLGINPMSGVVEGFRWCLLGRPAPGPMLTVSAVSIATLLIGGLFYFRRMEKRFADLV
jgi:lipopolysaccharide transport system permease protein